MTTERSGMSLESVRDWLRDPYNFNTPTFNELADAIDDHLSRDAIINVPKRDASFYADGEYGPADLAAIWNACCEAHKSFTARHAAVPDVVYENLAQIADGKVSVNDMQDMASEAYNVLRKAMLAQRDGGGKK